VTRIGSRQDLKTGEPGVSAPESQGERNTRRVFAGILSSRIAGLVRERIFAHYFGASLYMDAWRAANRLPNVIQNLLGEGTLSASFIPVYARLVEDGKREEARAFAGATLGLLLAVLGVATLLGVLLAPVLVGVLFIAFDAEQQARTTSLVRILFPMTALLAMSAWTLGVLNTHRRFLIPYTAPVLWNVAILVALGVGGWGYGLRGDPLLSLVALGAVAGGVLQLGVQVPATIRALGWVRPSLDIGRPTVRTAVANFGPVVAARGVANLSGWLDYALAAALASGAIAALGFAQTLYLLPISLFGLAAAAGELPELARTRPGDHGVLARSVQQGVERIAFFVVPSMVVYVALGDLVTAALFQSGAFGAPEVRLTWAVLAAYALGMGASATAKLLSATFHALGDTRTPARIAVTRMGISLGAGLTLMFPFDTLPVLGGNGGLRYGAVGLALGAAIGAQFELAALRRKLKARLGDVDTDGAHRGRMGRIVLAALGAGAIGMGLRMILPLATLHPILEAAIVLPWVGGAYVIGAQLLGVPLPASWMRRLQRLRGRDGASGRGSEGP
jgi:putative peptidoglycan lipid II flippase